MADVLRAQVLTGRFVQLEPVTERHRADLVGLAADPVLWTYVPFDPARGYVAKFEKLLVDMEAGLQIGFAVRRLADQAVVGSASYMAFSPENARLEIGAIWYTAPAQGTAVNPDTMYLMLDYAFAAGYNRVEFKADARNARSRGALRKLGAVEEGTLRQHMWLPQGRFRDSVYYAVLAESWPMVRARLIRRLKAFD
jgi:N-acetyltransferase